MESTRLLSHRLWKCTSFVIMGSYRRWREKLFSSEKMTKCKDSGDCDLVVWYSCQCNVPFEYRECKSSSTNETLIREHFSLKTVGARHCGKKTHPLTQQMIDAEMSGMKKTKPTCDCRKINTFIKTCIKFFKFAVIREDFRQAWTHKNQSCWLNEINQIFVF